MMASATLASGHGAHEQVPPAVIGQPAESEDTDDKPPEGARTKYTNDKHSESVPRRQGALLAVLVLGVAAVGVPIAKYLEYSRSKCPSKSDHWSFSASWFTVCVPVSLAFVAWCVTVRQRFQRGEPLHRWTGYFGALSLLHAASGMAFPASGSDCAPRYQVLWSFTAGIIAYYGSILVQWHLLKLRLRVLGRRHLARVVGATFWLGAVSMSVALISLITLSILAITSALPFEDVVWPAVLSFACSILMFCFCQIVGFSCGAWGLLTSAARAARSPHPGAAQAASWVAFTGLLTSMTAILSCAVLVVSLTTPSMLAMSVDHTFNCLSVAMLSGLVGPSELRRLASEAFVQINSYSTDQLQGFYLEFLAYLDETQVRWIRCGYLRRLAEAGSIMARCQDVPATEAIVGSEGFPRGRDDPKHRFVLSHPWLSKPHPDPDGVRLQALVQQLDLLDAADSDAIFIDFTGLPQIDQMNLEYQRLEMQQTVPNPGEHPALRTEAEEMLFQKALERMHFMYSVSNTPVIVLPMDDDVPPGMEYISRGWCFFEFSLAFSFGCIKNARVHPPVERLCKRAAELKLHTVEGFDEGFELTHFTNKGDKALVTELFEQTLRSGAGRMALTPRY